jgi:hypothetical protein
MFLVFYFIYFIGAFPGGNPFLIKNKPIRAEFLRYQPERVTKTDDEFLEEFKEKILRHRINNRNLLPPFIPENMETGLMGHLSILYDSDGGKNIETTTTEEPATTTSTTFSTTTFVKLFSSLRVF